MYEAMLAHVKATLERDGGSHGAFEPQRIFPFRDRFEHTQRVCGWARRLLLTEPEANDRQVLVAAIFHDSGYGQSPGPDHALASAEICREYLTRARFEPGEIGKIVYLVAAHSEKQRPREELCAEMRVLIDADLLDEQGAVTVLWDCMDEGARSKQSYEAAYRRLQGSYERILPKRERMRTDYGLYLYDQRLSILKNFLDQLRYELMLDEPLIGSDMADQAAWEVSS